MWALTQACVGGADFSGDGQSDEAEGQRPRKKKLESSLMQFVAEGGRGGKLRDALGKITEGVALAGEELGYPRHKVKQVKVPKNFPRKGGRTEFQKGKDSARLEDPVDL